MYTGNLGDVRKIESLQRRCAREVEGIGYFEYDERLRRVDVFSVKGRMLRLDLQKVWEVLNPVVDVGLGSLFVRAVGSTG